MLRPARDGANLRLMASRIARTLACLSLFGSLACGGSGFSTDDSGGGAGGTGGGASSGGAGSGGASSSGASSGTGANASGGSTSGGATGTGAGTGTGGNYVPGPGECTADHPCQNGGYCTGDDCGSVWKCTEPTICTQDIAEYCGCDGSTFTDSGSCPTRPFSHTGACKGGDTYDCNEDHILCSPPFVPLEPCPEGQVRSVQDECYGTCVPLTQCACSVADDCPGDNACYNTSKTCGPWLK